MLARMSGASPLHRRGAGARAAAGAPAGGSVRPLECGARQRQTGSLRPRAVRNDGETKTVTASQDDAGHEQSHVSRRVPAAEHGGPALDASPSSSSQQQEAEAGSDGSGGGGGLPAIAAPLGLALGLAALLGGGYLFKDQLRHFIDYFIHVAETWGPLGYLAYGGVYTLLEVLAVPAVPLTMTAGVIFGPVPGVIVVSGASTAAATLSFLIARYAARDKVLKLAEGNAKFKAIDRAIGKNGFKVVALLRLSPLLPLSLSNYFYGLTSVDLPSYVAGSWLGMLPGTVLYVLAGDYGRELLGDDGADGGLPVSRWQVGLGILVTVAILGYVGRLAKQALDEAEAEAGDAR